MDIDSLCDELSTSIPFHDSEKSYEELVYFSLLSPEEIIKNFDKYIQRYNVYLKHLTFTNDDKSRIISFLMKDFLSKSKKEDRYLLASKCKVIDNYLLEILEKYNKNTCDCQIYCTCDTDSEPDSF